LSVPNGPVSKRRKPNGTAVTPLATEDETFEVTHRVEIYYESYYDDEATRPPNVRRLCDGLNRAWNHLPNLPSSPLSIYAQRGSHKHMLIGLLEPLAAGVKLDPLRAFVTLPVVGDFSSLTHEHDFTTRHCDLIRAFLDLQDAKRAKITARLTFHPPDSDLFKDGTAQLSSLQRDHIITVVSIDFYVTLIDIDKTELTTSIVAEAQRRVLHALFPRSPSTQFTRPTVSNFIANLQPAPSLPPTVLAEHLQAKDLQCELLPFQRRSVYWMLTREGFTLSKSGNAIPLSTPSPPSPLWEQVSTPRGSTRYINRLNGELKKVEDIEPMYPILGGILAEEVGCGKTVESIALILLNSPKTRGPWNVSWNEMAGIPLHQVKVCPVSFPLSQG
jgi:SNF2-related domain